MASRRENLLRVTVDAATAGLDLSKDRGSIDERMLWEAENVWRSQRGVITKRPAFKQYATQIVEPTDVDTANGEVVSIVADNKSEWDFVQTGTDGVYAQFSHNDLVVSGWGNPTEETATITRGLQDSEEYATNNDLTLSFVMRATQFAVGNPFGAGYFIGAFTTKAGSTARFFSVNNDGLYKRNAIDSYGKINGTDNIANGSPHRVDFKFTGDTCATYIDGVLVDTNTWSYKTSISDNLLLFQARTDSSVPDDPYMVVLSSIILRDSNDGVFAPVISAIATQKQQIGTATKNRVLVAGEKYIWAEYETSGVWQPLISKQRDTTTFVPFRNYVVIINYSDASNFSELMLLDNTDTVEIVPNVPKCKFGAEFADRLWLSGDPANPKRLYYSGDRNPRKWIVPESGVDYALEDLLDAGYFDLPSGTDEKITLLSGKFFGMLLAATENAVYGITGSNPADFGRRMVSGEIGAAGARCGSGGLNDFMCMNGNGVTSVVTTDKYGDILSERKSYFVNQLFDPHNIGPRTLNQQLLKNSVLEFFQPMSMLALFVPSSSSGQLNKVYTCQFPEMLWYGPFSENVSCAATVTLAIPETSYLCIGTDDGRVKFMAPMYPDTSNMKISSAVIDGRSIDPALRMMVKSWKHIRVYVNPTGNWPITVRWKTDTGKWQSYTAGKLAGPHHAFVGTATVGSVMAADRSERHLIEIPLDVRGMSLKWEITGTAPKLSGLAVEVDFHVSGYEKEN